ncbi:hypothetical protein NT239_06000 [Chitinibacter sp. SCUT-21]|uniref:ApeP family dehydratase n=1 Tax=Chitinibacter sp. SCUT-21 TaxID=2970891 RepID=UPI0035A5CEFB
MSTISKPRYSPAEVLPHAAPMILLDEIVDYDEQSLTAALTVPADGFFNDAALAGEVPAYVAIEYMAQAVAALSGCRARARGEAPKIGFLLGTRAFDSNVASFKPGIRLTVSVNEMIQGDNGMGVFDARVSGHLADGSDIVVSARINGFQPPNPEAFLAA